MFQYPAFQFDFLNRREFDFKRVVSVPEFQAVSERFRAAAGRPVLMVPGASVGVLSGRTSTRRLDDFAWGTLLYPQIERKTRERLSATGVELLTAEADIRCGGKRLDTHLAIQAEPAALLTEESLGKFQITHCPTCGDYSSPRKKPVVPEGYQIRRSEWPDGMHLVTLAETLDVLASPEFMAAVQKLSLTGIGFAECGEYV